MGEIRIHTEAPQPAQGRHLFFRAPIALSRQYRTCASKVDALSPFIPTPQYTANKLMCNCHEQCLSPEMGYEHEHHSSKRQNSTLTAPESPSAAGADTKEKKRAEQKTHTKISTCKQLNKFQHVTDQINQGMFKNAALHIYIYNE